MIKFFKKKSKTMSIQEIKEKSVQGLRIVRVAINDYEKNEEELILRARKAISKKDEAGKVYIYEKIAIVRKARMRLEKTELLIELTNINNDISRITNDVFSNLSDVFGSLIKGTKNNDISKIFEQAEKLGEANLTSSIQLNTLLEALDQQDVGGESTMDDAMFQEIDNVVKNQIQHSENEMNSKINAKVNDNVFK